MAATSAKAVEVIGQSLLYRHLELNDVMGKSETFA